MDLFHVKCFIAVARMEHMSKAAEVLNISQPSLSKIIKSLENELDCKLFEKDGRNIRLSEYGYVFYKDVLPAVEQIDASVLHLQDLKGEAKNHFKIVAPPLFSFPELAPLLYSQHPGIVIENLSVPYPELTSALHKGLVDFCILGRPIDDDGLKCEVLTDDELIILVSEKHPKAYKNEAKLIEFKNDNFTDYAEVASVKSERERLCAEAGFVSKPALVGNTLFDLIEAVKQTNYVAFIPLSMLRNYKTEGTKAIRITEPECHSHLRLYWNPANSKKQSLKNVRKTIVDYFKTYSEHNR